MYMPPGVRAYQACKYSAQVNWKKYESQWNRLNNNKRVSRSAQSVGRRIGAGLAEETVSQKLSVSYPG
jgi:hypothetical protein